MKLKKYMEVRAKKEKMGIKEYIYKFAYENGFSGYTLEAWVYENRRPSIDHAAKLVKATKGELSLDAIYERYIK